MEGVAPIEASVLRHCVRLRLPLLREPTIIILTAIETAHPARPPYSVVQACYEPGEDLHLAGLGRAACRFTIRVHVVPSSGDPSLYGQVAVAWAGLPRKPRPLPDSPAARQAMQASYAAAHTISATREFARLRALMLPTRRYRALRLPPPGSLEEALGRVGGLYFVPGMPDLGMCADGGILVMQQGLGSRLYRSYQEVRLMTLYVSGLKHIRSQLRAELAEQLDLAMAGFSDEFKAELRSELKRTAKLFRKERGEQSGWLSAVHVKAAIKAMLVSVGVTDDALHANFYEVVYLQWGEQHGYDLTQFERLRDGVEYRGRFLVLCDDQHFVVAVQADTALGRGLRSIVEEDSDFFLTPQELWDPAYPAAFSAFERMEPGSFPPLPAELRRPNQPEDLVVSPSLKEAVNSCIDEMHEKLNEFGEDSEYDSDDDEDDGEDEEDEDSDSEYDSDEEDDEEEGKEEDEGSAVSETQSTPSLSPPPPSSDIMATIKLGDDTPAASASVCPSNQEDKAGLPPTPHLPATAPPSPVLKADPLLTIASDRTDPPVVPPCPDASMLADLCPPALSNNTAPSWHSKTRSTQVEGETTDLLGAALQHEAPAATAAADAVIEVEQQQQQQAKPAGPVVPVLEAGRAVASEDAKPDQAAAPLDPPAVIIVQAGASDEAGSSHADEEEEEEEEEEPAQAKVEEDAAVALPVVVVAKGSEEEEQLAANPAVDGYGEPGQPQQQQEEAMVAGAATFSPLVEAVCGAVAACDRWLQSLASAWEPLLCPTGTTLTGTKGPVVEEEAVGLSALEAGGVGAAVLAPSPTMKEDSRALQQPAALAPCDTGAKVDVAVLHPDRKGSLMSLHEPPSSTSSAPPSEQLSSSSSSGTAASSEALQHIMVVATGPSQADGATDAAMAKHREEEGQHTAASRAGRWWEVFGSQLSKAYEWAVGLVKEGLWVVSRFFSSDFWGGYKAGFGYHDLYSRPPDGAGICSAV